MKKLTTIFLCTAITCSLLAPYPVFAAQVDQGTSVIEDSNGNTSEDPVTGETIEDLQKQIKSLKKKNKALKAENKELKAQIETLTASGEAGASAEPAGGELSAEPVQETPKLELPENVANADTELQYSDKATVQLVQQTLNAAGYNCGTPDGVAGANTTTAINNYETDHGLTVNGVITDQLLESLGIAEQIAEQARKEAAKAEYSPDYTYEQLARNPDTYVGSKVKFTGKVLQAETGDVCYMRLALNSNYDTIIFVTYMPDVISYRLLENDIVTIYGTANATYSYEAVSRATITIPWVMADMIEIQ